MALCIRRRCLLSFSLVCDCEEFSSAPFLLLCLIVGWLNARNMWSTMSEPCEKGNRLLWATAGNQSKSGAFKIRAEPSASKWNNFFEISICLVGFYCFLNELEISVNSRKYFWLVSGLAGLEAASDDADKLLLAFTQHHQRLARVALACWSPDATCAKIPSEVVREITFEHVLAFAEWQNLETGPPRCIHSWSC